MTDLRAADFHEALLAALRTGHAVLARGGTSLDAVESAVVWLEDCPLFNAGRGSAFTREGQVEMEASIVVMELGGRSGARTAGRRKGRPRSPRRG